MKLDDMLHPDAPVPVTPESIHTLVKEVRRLRQASDMEALAFYAFTSALVQKAGGRVELSADEQEDAASLQLEVADMPDGATVVRIAPIDETRIIEHKPTLALPHHPV